MSTSSSTTAADIQKTTIKNIVNLVQFAETRGCQMVPGTNDRYYCPWRAGADSDGFWLGPDRYYDHVEEKGGDAIEFVQRLDNVDFKTALQILADYAGLTSSAQREKKTRGPDEIYSFYERDGTLVLQECKRRYKNGKKKIWQRRPATDAERQTGHALDAEGNPLLNSKGKPYKTRNGYVNTLQGSTETPRPLYRESEVVDAETVIICEGPKDCELACDWGWPATTNPEGAGKWLERHTKTLGGKFVYLVLDNDSKGREHAEHIASQLYKNGCSLKLITPSSAKSGDLTDWNNNEDGSAEELQKLIDAAPWWEPQQEQQVSEQLPEIDVETNWLSLIRKLTEALLPYNEFYTRAGEVVRLVDGAEFEPVTAAGACSEFERFALFYKEDDKSGDVEFTRLHENVARVILQAPETHRRLPEIKRVADYPMPIQKQGEVSLIPSGYDPDTQIYTDPNGPTPEQMSLEEGFNAIQDLLQDFCFAECQGDGGARYWSNALIYLLTSHCRLLFEPQRAPIFYAGGNRPGVGKDYLLGLAIVLSTGRDPEFHSPTQTADETRKRLLSVCRAGHRFMLISNAKGYLSDESLEQAATSPVHRDRVLGKSQELTFPNTAIYGISGNGLSYSEDLARRIVPIELAFFDESIEDRHYRHPDLYAHVRENRSYYLGALQAMVETWVHAGCPVGSKRKNSFVNWSEIIGGILEACGLANPINTDPINSTPNESAEHFAMLLKCAYENHGDREIDKSDLQKLASDNELFAWFGDLESEKKAKTRFGKLLGRMEHRRFDGMYLLVDRSRSRPAYQVIKDK